MPPKVSILLPNLNNRPYLEERLRTIRDQTFSDWELFIVDGYSDDGAWQYFQDAAREDPRIRISQEPREGIYAGWNSSVRLARGEYVYIATSDDTMSPRFLETTVRALDDHPECDLAHCKLTIIDEKGSPHPALKWDDFPCATYFGPLINQKHIRLAPHDGLLHCGAYTVYTSIIQLLIRRSLFDRVGLFRTDLGTMADFEWEMRASLVTNTIHIPEYLAAWRVHRNQGTDLSFLATAGYRAKLMKMIDLALGAARRIKPETLKGINRENLKFLYRLEKLQIELRDSKNGLRMCKTVLRWLLAHPKALWYFYRSSKTPGRNILSIPWRLEFCRRLLMRYGVADNIVLLKE
jgi:glycosyltransferase involved in cell wall biosynthesis